MTGLNYIMVGGQSVHFTTVVTVEAYLLLLLTNIVTKDGLNPPPPKPPQA